MNTIRIILSIAIITCFFAGSNSLAMKRTHMESAFRPAQTSHGQNIWQAWVTWPNEKDILCSFFEEEGLYKLLFNFEGENENDAGYGEPALPSEIFWFQREENISGKEMLDFLKDLFTSLKPKIIYLNDAATKKFDNIEIKLRVLCPFISGSSFYAAHAQFEVVDCEALVCHQGTIIRQSKEKYETYVARLRDFPLCNLVYFLNKKEASTFSKVLAKFNINTLGELFKALSDPAMKDDLHYLYNLLTDSEGSMQKSNQLFEIGMSILNSTTLWKCEAYARE